MTRPRVGVLAFGAVYLTSVAASVATSMAAVTVPGPGRLTGPVNRTLSVLGERPGLAVGAAAVGMIAMVAGRSVRAARLTVLALGLAVAVGFAALGFLDLTSSPVDLQPVAG